MNLDWFLLIGSLSNRFNPWRMTMHQKVKFTLCVCWFAILSSLYSQSACSQAKKAEPIPGATKKSPAKHDHEPDRPAPDAMPRPTPTPTPPEPTPTPTPPEPTPAPDDEKPAP